MSSFEQRLFRPHLPVDRQPRAAEPIPSDDGHPTLTMEAADPIERTERPVKPRVFISYIIQGQLPLVEKLAKTVRDEYGCANELDQDVGFGEDQIPPGGWHHWMEQGIRQADRTGLLFSEDYRRDFETVFKPGHLGAGVRFELGVVKDMIERQPDKIDRFFALYKPVDGPEAVPDLFIGHAVRMDDPASMAATLWGGRLPTDVEDRLAKSKTNLFLEDAENPDQAFEWLVRRLVWSGNELRDHVLTLSPDGLSGLAADSLGSLQAALRQPSESQKQTRIADVVHSIVSTKNKMMGTGPKTTDALQANRQFFRGVLDPLRGQGRLAEGFITAYCSKYRY